MPDFSNWDTPLFDLANIIARRGVSITFVRGTTTMAVQTVIAVSPGKERGSEISGDAGSSGTRALVLIGYRSYSGQPDFDVQRGDRFLLNGTQYRVASIDNAIPGRREAFAEMAQ